ncbi:MAG: hypothetical protein FWD58_02025 [Firmicutes bacterium]|nr:hypothetical protein [Bacillota bacterium]
MLNFQSLFHVVFLQIAGAILLSYLAFSIYFFIKKKYRRNALDAVFAIVNWAALLSTAAFGAIAILTNLRKLPYATFKEPMELLYGTWMGPALLCAAGAAALLCAALHIVKSGGRRELGVRGQGLGVREEDEKPKEECEYEPIVFVAPSPKIDFEAVMRSADAARLEAAEALAALEEALTEAVISDQWEVFSEDEVNGEQWTVDGEEEVDIVGAVYFPPAEPEPEEAEEPAEPPESKPEEAEEPAEPPEPKSAIEVPIRKVRKPARRPASQKNTAPPPQHDVPTTLSDSSGHPEPSKLNRQPSSPKMPSAPPSKPYVPVRKYVVLNRRNAATLFEYYLSEKDAPGRQKLEDAISKVIIK